MTSRFGAAMAAGFLALGIVIGAAGPLVARDATAQDMAMEMGQMADMMSMMDAGQMADMMSTMDAGQMADMMSMMDAGAMPNASAMPLAGHESHHPQPGPESTR